MNLQEERNNVDKQLRYQCRCSFLEVILNKCYSDDECVCQGGKPLARNCEECFQLINFVLGNG